MNIRFYYFVGVMPEAVQAYITNNNFEEVRDIQNKILLGYEYDFAKYAPISIMPKIRLVWQTILSQLAQENRKFTYSQLKKGARAKEFEEAINWLVNAGMLLKSNLNSKPIVPLKTYVNFDVFKLYLLDIGLLNAMGEINKQILLNKNQILKEIKGALTDQYVAQELKSNHHLHYWIAENATAKIDFIIQKIKTLYPLKLKQKKT